MAINDTIITKARERIDERFVSVNDTIAKKDVFRYVKALDAWELLADVLENYQEEIGDELAGMLDNPQFIDRILSDIEEDDYILPDWYSVTDYHEYGTDTVSLIEKAYKDYKKKA